MKRTFYLFGVLFVLAAIVMSCKEDKKTNVQLANGSATITGYAYVNLDVRNDTDAIGNPEIQNELVPQNTRLYARINEIDLVEFPLPDTVANYKDILLTTTVDASGMYTFTVPANNRFVRIAITSDDFRADYITSDTTSESKIFYLPETADSLVDNLIRINDLKFVQEPI